MNIRRGFAIAVLGVAAVSVGAASSPHAIRFAGAQMLTPGSGAPGVRRTIDFIGSIGVNTHFEYTDGTYAKVGPALADLDYIGVHTVRDGTPNPNGGVPNGNYVAALKILTAAGVKFDMLTGTGMPLDVTMQQINATAALHPGAVIAVEGPNEINNAPAAYLGLKGEAAALAFQKDLYSAVHVDPQLRHVRVYLYTGGTPLKSARLRGLADAATLHPYPHQGVQPYGHITSSFLEMFGSGHYGKVMTEIGYYSRPQSRFGSGVDEVTQAKGTLNILLDAYKQGVERTFLYQLLAAYPNSDSDIDTEYGLFRLDGSPKPVAVALHAMTSILSDQASSAMPRGAARTIRGISGLPESGHSLLLQKRPGVYDLLVWAEPPFWDEARHAPVAAPESKVVVNLIGRHWQYTVFDPMDGGRAIATGQDTVQLAVTIRDYPLIVELHSTAHVGL